MEKDDPKNNSNESLINQVHDAKVPLAGSILESIPSEGLEKVTSILEENLELIREDIEEIGGIEEINEIWNGLTNIQKAELIKELNKLHSSYKKGVNIQEVGEELLDPRHKAFQEWKKNGNFLGRIVGPVGYVTGIYPATGAMLEIVGAASVLLTKIKLKRQMRKYK